MTLAELLYSLLENRRAADSISEALKGDIRAIHDWDVRDLVALPGVGEGTAGKLMALTELIRRLVKS